MSQRHIILGDGFCQASRRDVLKQGDFLYPMGCERALASRDEKRKVERSNGLALSCAAPIDREGTRVVSSLQNRPGLRGAQRRQLQRLVGPHFTESLTAAEPPTRLRL